MRHAIRPHHQSLLTSTTRRCSSPVRSLLFALALTAAAAAPALAFDCNDTHCSVQLSDSVSLVVAGDQVTSNSEGYQLSGEVVIATAEADFHLLDANLLYNDATGEMYGEVELPLADLLGFVPELADLVDASVGAHALVGLVRQSSLLERPGMDELPLAEIEGEDPLYLVFSVSAGAELGMDLGDLLGKEGVNIGLEAPGGKSITVIFDPMNPYVFVSTDAQEALKGLITDATAADDSQATTERSTGTTSQEGGDSSGDEKTGGAALRDVAFSWKGGIPFTPETTWGLEGASYGQFGGNLYVEGEIPIYKELIWLDGNIVAKVDLSQQVDVELGGNGTAIVGLGFLDFASVELEVGDASAGFRVAQDGGYGYFSGRMSGTGALGEWLPLQPRSEMRVAGMISDDLEASFLKINGQFNMGIGKLAADLGLDLEDFVTVTGDLLVNREGVRVQGNADASIHPDIDLGGSVAVDAFLSWDDLEYGEFTRSHCTLRGDISIAGEHLGATAEARLDARGFAVTGEYVTPLTRVFLAGGIDQYGAWLEGEAEAKVPFEKINEALDSAQGEVATARAKVVQEQVMVDLWRSVVKIERAEHDRKVQDARDKVNSLQKQITYQRSVVQGERNRDAQRLADQRAKVEKARAEVRQWQSEIDYEHRRIADRNREIRSWESWYNNLPWWEQSYQWAKLSYETTWRGVEIGGRYVKIGALEASKGAADGVLWTYSQALRAMERAARTIPIDADPRVAGLISMKEGADGVLRLAQQAIRTFPIDADPRVAVPLAALEIAKGALTAAEALLDALPRVEGDLSATVHLYLSTWGFWGDASVNVNGHTIVGGSVTLTENPSFCIDLGFGDVCVDF